MAEEIIWERMSQLDPYDREERCRKTMRTLMKAIFMRLFAGVLLLVAVLRSGAAPVALGLSAFALILILSGLIPLVQEFNKQRTILKESLRQQKTSEQ